MICFPSKDNCGEDSPLKSVDGIANMFEGVGKVRGSAPYYDVNTENGYVHISQVPLVFSLAPGYSGVWSFYLFLGLKCFIKMSCITPILSTLKSVQSNRRGFEDYLTFKYNQHLYSPTCL